ncbi:MAG: DUF2066 domain-containing protein [Alphaproteobacteria bacterium]|nr:MAG: DUF2066 domain-containing protein [Alphaproteobacteria bacterium]
MARTRNPFARAWIGFVLAIFLAVAGQALAEANASDEDLFTARDVMVDVSSDNAAKARDEAVVKAQIQALETVLKRLGDEKAALPPGADKRLDEFVSSFEVQNERRSAKRYIGTFTVRLRPAAIRALVMNGGTGAGGVTTVAHKPVLILPLVVSAEQAVLWEHRTPWREAWEAAVQNRGLVPFVLPAGGVNDITLLGSNEALAGDAQAILRLATRYNADSAVRVMVSDPISPQGATVEIRRYDAQGAQDLPPMTVAPQPGETPQALLMRGARMVADHLTESWKRQAAVNTAGPVQTLMVTALTPDLSVWAEIDRRLRLSSALEKRELLVQTRHGARLALSFRGTPEQLAVLLRQSDLALTRLADGNWVLALRESPASAP